MTLKMTRRGLAVGAVAAALPLLSGCATFSPATTLVPYNASDGTGLQLGQLEAHNLLVVGAAKGAEGVLSGALVNTGNDPLTVAVSTQGAPTPVTIQVAAHTMVKLTADSTSTSAATAGSVDSTATVLVPSLAQPPGSLVTVQIATQAGGQKQVKVPVVPPQNEYATITAPPTTPSATQSPSGQPAPGGGESAQPTTSPS
jgi:hypothetical protein